MQKEYCPKKIEESVQRYWKKKKQFSVFENPEKKKYYCLSMMPYPSGKLHMGHVRNYTIGDVIARYQRMLGKNVLHPIGWDAFGLPSEVAAIRHNTTPDKWTFDNIRHMKGQLETLGFSYDWQREITTCLPEYYCWEQKFFISLYNKNLAYKKKSIVNWCPNDKTVLANEQVIKNRCWRCDTKVIKKNILQWFIKITDYADELLSCLETLHYWPDEVKNMQRNWIGRSEGIKVFFTILGHSGSIPLYTESPDMLTGCTYIKISTSNFLTRIAAKKDLYIRKFVEKYKNIDSFEKNAYVEQEGIYSGFDAVNPITRILVPIWIVSCLENKYNDGLEASIAIPGHLKVDYDFAKKYNLPIRKIIKLSDGSTSNFSMKDLIKGGKLFNSGKFNGLSLKNASRAIRYELIRLKSGKPEVCFQLHDWNISRQRSWGAPIPMVNLKNGNVLPVSDLDLPVVSSRYSHLNNMSRLIKNNISETQLGEIESETFDTFMESSWYYARYTCPQYHKGMINSNAANYWLPVDCYVGGIEHATMHLLYIRFFHKLLRDAGMVDSDEPVKKLICQGMVLADAYYFYDQHGTRRWINASEVTIEHDKHGKNSKIKDNNGNTLFHAGMIKMSKSKNNGVDPQAIIARYGADTVRLFIMFAAPVHMSLEWKEDGVKGMFRFLKRLWRIVHQHTFTKPIPDVEINNDLLEKYQIEFRHFLNETIVKVSNDINKRQSFNTAIAAVMKLINKLSERIAYSNNYLDRKITQEALLSVTLMLYPFTPHICFIIWRELKGNGNIDFAVWPTIKKREYSKQQTKINIYIDGKFKKKLDIDSNFSKSEVIKTLITTGILKANGIKKVIYVSEKLMNIVTKI